tara:strand:+ start:8369 stop:9154 length:786 start_codon:yes stop_codon:yes gene_type:complete
MSEIDCISVREIKFTKTYPMTRNHKGSLVQQPHFTISAGEYQFSFVGRDVMWSFLDALFVDDNLPRGPVEDDLFAPDIHSPSMYSLFNEFRDEAVEAGNEYLILYHDNAVVKMVTSLLSLGLSNDIEYIGHLMSGTEISYAPFKYRDKKGSHLRRSAYWYINKCKVQVVDLGRTWYLRVVGADSNGGYVGICPPVSIIKSDRETLAMTLKNFTAEASQYTPIEIRKESWYADGEKRVEYVSSYLSREYDMLLYRRKIEERL